MCHLYKCFYSLNAKDSNISFYVAGNHCFYQGEYKNRIHFLQKKSYLLPNSFHILGTTLWSHHAPSRRDTCLENDEAADVESPFINDHDTDFVDPIRLWVYEHKLHEDLGCGASVNLTSY
jgi:hypothetical protein